MGQEQLKTGEGKKLQEKTPPASEKDRASASFERRIQNTPAMAWPDSKKAPLSKPT
jgi:hypothetical protein